MRETSFAIALGVIFLIACPSVCRAQQGAPGKWINRTLANRAASEANQRAREIPPGRWWHLPYFATQLDITNAQKEQLDRLFDYNRNRLAQIKMQMEQERSELVNAVEGQHLNEAAAEYKMRKLENSRTLLASTRFTYSLEVRKLLGYDRFKRLRMLFRNWHGLQEYISGEDANKPGRRAVAAGPPGPSGQRPIFPASGGRQPGN